jgi:hypothetical protein
MSTTSREPLAFLLASTPPLLCLTPPASLTLLPHHTCFHCCSARLCLIQHQPPNIHPARHTSQAARQVPVPVTSTSRRRMGASTAARVHSSSQPHTAANLNERTPQSSNGEWDAGSYATAPPSPADHSMHAQPAPGVAAALMKNLVDPCRELQDTELAPELPSGGLLPLACLPLPPMLVLAPHRQLHAMPNCMHPLSLCSSMPQLKLSPCCHTDISPSFC